MGFIKSAIEGPAWLAGGSFGVEASVVALVVGTKAGVVILVMAYRRGNMIAQFWMRQH